MTVQAGGLRIEFGLDSGEALVHFPFQPEYLSLEVFFEIDDEAFEVFHGTNSFSQ